MPILSIELRRAEQLYAMYNNKNLICEGMLVKLDSDSVGLWQKVVNAP